MFFDALVHAVEMEGATDMPVALGRCVGSQPHLREFDRELDALWEVEGDYANVVGFARFRFVMAFSSAVQGGYIDNKLFMGFWNPNV